MYNEIELQTPVSHKHVSKKSLTLKMCRTKSVHVFTRMSTLELLWAVLRNRTKSNNI